MEQPFAKIIQLNAQIQGRIMVFVYHCIHINVHIDDVE